MRICYLADYRSPIARNWIGHFMNRDHEVHVISTHPAEHVEQDLASFTVVPIGFAGLRANGIMKKYFAASGGHTRPTSVSRQRWIGRAMRGVGSTMLDAYEWIAPFELRRYTAQVESAVRACKPDLAHAMRIPFEGILAATALRATEVPFLVSVWGNDFTLHAKLVPTVGSATRGVLARCDALHADCHRDIRLARLWGLDEHKPTTVIPTSGGIRLGVFHPDGPTGDTRERWGIPNDAMVVINPRGIRPGYVRNDNFFASIPAIVERMPNTIFMAVGMHGHPAAEQWVRKYGIEESVRLLPTVAHADMAPLFRCADITVSPAIHDGTPNTLLEAMACGAFPVAGNIESVREWIEHGENGLLCDPNDAASLASATLEALSNASLREKARARNLELIAAEAEYESGMRRAEEFYSSLIHD